MNFSTFTNVITILFCSAVLFQSVRLLRCLREVKGDAFGAMVATLDSSTAQARSVLADLRETLRVDCAANARVIATGTAMREELTVMAGIADAVAERIVEAVEKTNPRPVPKVATKPDMEPAVKRTRAPRSPAAGTMA